jgi:hypothetical protein
MTLAELTQAVYDITGRSDRTAETLTGIQAATLKAHHQDYYFKDIFESGLNFGSAEFIQSLDYRALMPRWRALKYLRKYDNAGQTPGMFLDVLIPELVLDRYKIEKTDICYVAGAYVQIKSSTQEQYYLFGCYRNPDITTGNYDSWIALDHPFAIIYDAAATVFKAIGKDEEAAAYRTLGQEQRMMVATSNIVATGY